MRRPLDDYVTAIDSLLTVAIDGTGKLSRERQVDLDKALRDLDRARVDAALELRCHTLTSRAA